MDIVTAHRLGHFIEWTNAKARVMARDRRGMRKRDMRKAAENEFDELAATCLGDLIHHIANGGKMRAALTTGNREK